MQTLKKKCDMIYYRFPRNQVFKNFYSEKILMIQLNGRSKVKKTVYINYIKICMGNKKEEIYLYVNTSYLKVVELLVI